jgi:hypothetical protein
MNKLKLPFALSEINGNEIIDYLNEQLKSDDLPFDGTMISGDFVFDSQQILKKNDVLTYTLSFKTFWNNWGKDTVVYGVIYISHQKINENIIWAWFDDPVGGDGTEGVVVELLTKWLPTHKFSETNEELYTNLIQDIQDDMVLIYTPDGKTTTDIIDEIIEKLTKAKSYIK